MYTLEQIAGLLETAPRHEIRPDRREGQPEPAPVPEAEAGRYIKLRDGQAREIAAALRRIAAGESPRGVSLERR